MYLSEGVAKLHVGWVQPTIRFSISPPPATKLPCLLFSLCHTIILRLWAAEKPSVRFSPLMVGLGSWVLPYLTNYGNAGRGIKTVRSCSQAAALGGKVVRLGSSESSPGASSKGFIFCLFLPPPNPVAVREFFSFSPLGA